MAAGGAIQSSDWTRPAYEDFRTILMRTAALDKALGQKDCEDPQKGLWMKDVEARLDRIEKAIGKKGRKK